eukprot:scaffold318442_cov18-Tisochrysis_lutea.AAC.1
MDVYAGDCARRARQVPAGHAGGAEAAGAAAAARGGGSGRGQEGQHQRQGLAGSTAAAPPRQ